MFKNSKYESIDKIYNIQSINNDNIVVNYNNCVKYIYIFEIEPIHILNLDNTDKLNIIEKYTEFLKELNYDLEICINSSKLNIDDYLNIIVLDDNIDKNNLINMYKNELKTIISNDSIYSTNYYIIAILDNCNSKDLYLSLKNIEKTACLVNIIDEKEKLEKLLYSNFNKVII
ncbi:MAG: hypothetical protein RSE41_03440 [Clostridia bacterium]